MPLSVLKCPQCNAPLSPSKLARFILCPFCGANVRIDETAVSVTPFREALQAWNAPATHGYTTWCSLNGGSWALQQLLARGELSDVYLAERARWPSERVLFKVLRDPADAPLFDHEWDVLEQLQRGDTSGFSTRLPEPVTRGVIRSGPHTGARAMAFRWPSGFLHTFEAVRRAYPKGVDPRAAVWMWRRILELLAFLHRAGTVHGAVLPQHLLAEENEHGVRLAGYSCADAAGAPLRAVCSKFEGFYPRALRDSHTLTALADIQMSARCIAFVLGGDPTTGAVPDAVPAPLATLVRSVAADGARADSSTDAWALRGLVGEAGHAAFGKPGFYPLVMPGSPRNI